MTTCYQHIVQLHKLCQFQTRESGGPGPASNSEIMRWFKAKAIRINYQIVGPNDELPGYVAELTLFPSSKKRVTLLRDTLIEIDEPPQDQAPSV